MGVFDSPVISDEEEAGPNFGKNRLALEPETVALARRFTTPPTAARAASINTLIASLKTAGVWSKLDALYLMAAADAQAGQRNWIADQYNLTPVGSPIFTANQGYKGAGTAYIDAGVNINALAKYQRDDAHIADWIRQVPSGNPSCDIGIFSGTNDTRIRSTNGANPSGYRINQASTTNTTAPITFGTGLHLAVRTGSNATMFYHNNAESQAGSVASTALTASPLGFFRGVDGSYSDAQISYGSFGSSLNATDKSNLYAALLTYLQAVGAA